MKFLKEPFVQFLLIGLAIFIVDHFVNRTEAGPNEIIITKDDVRRLQLTYEQNWNRIPDSATTKVLIQEFIDSEILYQEALKLQLDHNDEIVKRRLRQKYEFIAQDLASLSDPSEEDLKNYYKNNLENYLSPALYTFAQVYVNPDKRQRPERDASIIYEQIKGLSPDDAQSKGDDSYLPYQHESINIQRVQRDFGSRFAASLLEATLKEWSAPFQSGIGWHMIYLEEIEKEGQIPFDDVVDEVVKDWKADNEGMFMSVLLERLRGQYKIVQDYE